MLRLKREYKDKPNINADRLNQKGERVSILDLRARLFSWNSRCCVEICTPLFPLNAKYTAELISNCTLNFKCVRVLRTIIYKSTIIMNMNISAHS